MWELSSKLSFSKNKNISPSQNGMVDLVVTIAVFWTIQYIYVISLQDMYFHYICLFITNCVGSGCKVVRLNISIHNIKKKRCILYIYISHQGPVCDVGSGYTAKKEHEPGIHFNPPPMFKPKLRPLPVCICVSVAAVELHLLIDLSTKSKGLLGL